MTPDTTCYVPGIGEMTAGQIAEAVRAEQEPGVDDPWEATLQMWEYIAFHPDARPWENSSRTSQEPVVSPVSEPTSDGQGDPSTSSGTATANVSNAA